MQLNLEKTIVLLAVLNIFDMKKILSKEYCLL